MKILLIEDEKPAADKLELLIKKYNPDFDIIERLPSVEKSIDFLSSREKEIDLIFMDIQLIDGVSFDIFKKVPVQKPVIFTTAFNEYAIEAFTVNSIDYLLKPITFEALSKSLRKIESMKKNLPGTSEIPIQLQDLAKLLSGTQNNYRNRFMVKVGEHIKSIVTKDIDVFYADGRTVYIVTNEKRKYIIDYKLEDVCDLLDPTLFYRINRSVIVNLNAIEDVVVYSNSRLKIRTKHELEKDMVVSREKVGDFKKWFSGTE